MPKRSLPWSGNRENEYDEDYSPYTRVRLIMHNGCYEDELDLLRLKNSELQAQVTELDNEIDEIMNIDLEDLVSLKEDVHFYYTQYRQARLQVLELQEKLSRTRVDGTPEKRLSSKVIPWRIETSDIKGSHLQNTQEVVSSAVNQRDKPSEAESSVPSIASKDNGSSDHDLQSAAASHFDFDNNDRPSNPPPSPNNDISSSGHAQTSVIVTNNETGTTVNNDKIGARQKLPYPSDAPSFGWFYDAFIYLNVDLGTHYSKLLCRWVEHERKNQWICPNDYREGFGKPHRPLLCNKWIRNRRYYRFQAEVDKDGCSTTEFTSEVWDWWIALQPKRQSLGGLIPPVDTEVENPLDKHGKHGWPVLLACVKWWAIGLQHHFNDDSDDSEEQKDKWVTLVGDMTKTLEGLQG
ncbi:hypothetical protein F5879DRAFT_990587 [Lentinula edodes]|nr:hypothetical protein GG344DRAFT_77161 [Lentinula edodes]KAJ3902931.1 hypothetical protein F5879DRAFT_990587 [Lentinula edodes]